MALIITLTNAEPSIRAPKNSKGEVVPVIVLIDPATGTQVQATISPANVKVTREQLAAVERVMAAEAPKKKVTARKSTTRKGTA